MTHLFVLLALAIIIRVMSAQAVNELLEDKSKNKPEWE